MKKYNNFKVSLGSLILGMLLTINAFGQTVHIDPVTEGGFELPGSFAGNGWTLVNDASHQWFVGTTTFASGVNGAYISNDGGVSNSYVNTLPQTSHFYRDVVIPAGENVIMLGFSYKGTGEGGWDRMLIYTTTTAVTPVAGAPASNSTVLAGATLVYTSPITATYQNVSFQLPAALAGTTVRLIFTWQNDGSVGTNPASAIDNISLTSQAPAPLNGIYTIDNTLPTSPTIPVSGGNFNSFTAAITYLNLNGISGPVTFNVISGETFAESPQTITGTGTLANPIIFQKFGAGANPIFLGTNGIGTVDGALTISGGDYITFDGIFVTDNPANTTNATKMEYGYFIKNISAADGAQNISIKNCTISLDRINTGTYGVFQNVATVPSAATGSNSNNIYDNISIQNSYRGMHLNGNAAFPDALCEIRNCTIGAASANDIGGVVATQSYGIRSTNSSAIKIHHNIVRNVTVNTTVDGILMELGQGNCELYNNNISAIRNGGTASVAFAVGIRANLATTGAHTTKVYNNFVANITSGYTGGATATRVIKGIFIQSVGGGTLTLTHNVDFNTVSIDGSASPNVSSSCFEIGTATGPVMNIRNNIFSNFTGAQAGVAKHFTWRSTSATAVGNTGSISNYNDLYILNTTNGFVGQGNITDLATLTNWQTAMVQDLNSLSTDPVLVNITTNLHSSASALDGTANSAGITWVLDDIDSQVRSVPTDIGADDFTLSACAGTPAPGTTLSTASSVCPSVSFTLSLSATPTGLTGITYQWQSSPDNITFSNIVGATSSSYSGTQSVATYYQCVVTCTVSGLSGTSTPVQVNMSPLASCYCTSSATSVADEDIFNVTLSTLNNSSTCATTGGAGSVINQYSDYTAVGAPVITQGTAYPFSVQIGTCGGSFTNSTRIFIDFNQNGVFTDPGETVYTSAAGTAGPHIESGNISVPLTATIGNTKMRVVTVETGTPTSITPCGTYTWGETEDYLVNIIASVPCSGTPSGGSTQSTLPSVCSGTSYTLSMSTPPSGMTGITIQWQSSPDGITYSNIAGATNSTYTTTQTSATYYQAIINCTLSGLADTTTALQVTMNPFMNCYCTSNPTTAADEEILNVTVGSLNNLSTCATTGGPGSILNRYSNYTGVAAPNLAKTATVSFSIQVGTCGGNFPSGTAIFIDYNQNGLFTDAGEQVYTTPVTTNGPHMVTGTFVVPAGAATGTTGMRVINAEGYAGAAITPCLIFGYGETEDYVVNIVPLPPNPPTPVQSATPPTCVTGTDLTVPGTPAAGDAWYWQTTALGTSTVNPVSGAYTVYLNGTYYVRTYNALYSIWSIGSDSVVVSNIPLAPTPPAPTATSPSCLNTSISIASPAAGTAYFWQGTNSTGASNALDASTPFIANTSGTYYVAAYDSATSCWSNTNSISVVIETYVPAQPTSTADSIVICAGTLSAVIDAASGGSGSVTSSFGLNLVSTGTGAATFTVTVPSIPAGATITSTQLEIIGATAIGGSFRSEIRVALSGATTLAPTQISTLTSAGVITPDPSIAVPSLPLAGGSVTLSITETFDDGGTDATFTEVRLVITYTLPPATINWWDAATAGTLQGSGSPFETIGTAFLPNSNTAGTYTFYAAATSGACSSTRLPIDVIINPLPVMVLNDTAICSGTNYILNAQNPGDTYLWNTSDTTQTISVSSGGLYYVDITTSLGCSARDSINLIINSLPIVNLGADIAFCAGDSILIDAGNTGFNYLWSDSTTNQTINVGSTGDYFVTVINPATTCYSSDTITITVNAWPVINFGIDTALCIGDTLVLDAGNPGSTYLWSNSSTDQTLTVNAVGTYFVTISDPVTTCVNADTISISINSLPVVSIGMDTAICFGDTLTLDAGNAGASYMWSDTSGLQTLNVFSAGNYSVLVVDPNGCKGNDSINVAINTLPVVNLGTDTTQCAGTVIIDAANTGSTFVWNDLTTAQTLTAGATGLYYVSVTNINGCTSSDSVNVTINALPVLNFGPDISQCGGSVLLDAGNPGFSYLWYNSTTSQTLTVYSSNTVSVTVTNPVTGCLKSDTINIVLNQYPIVNLGSDISQCAGTVTLNAGNTGAAFMWNTSASTQTVNVSASGTYYVGVTVSGCTAFDSIMVNIYSLPTVVFPAIAPVCMQGLPFALAASPIGGVFSGGVAVSGNMFDPTVAIVGVNTVLYTYTDANSCTNSITQDINVRNCTGIEEQEGFGDVNVYPNPTSGMFTISVVNADFKELNISVVNIQGKEVYNFTDKNISSDYNKQIDLEGLAKGIYYIKLNTGDDMKIQKLIIN